MNRNEKMLLLGLGYMLAILAIYGVAMWAVADQATQGF